MNVERKPWGNVKRKEIGETGSEMGQRKCLESLSCCPTVESLKVIPKVKLSH